MTSPFFGHKPLSEGRRGASRLQKKWADLQNPKPPKASVAFFSLRKEILSGPGWDQVVVIPQFRKTPIAPPPDALVEVVPTSKDIVSAIARLEQRVNFLEGKISKLDGTDLEITEPDEFFDWGTKNTALLEPFRGGMIALRLPEGIVAAGKTTEEFETQMKALGSANVNNLYVVATDVFF